MVTVVIVTVAGLFAFLRYTRVGLRIRAGTLDLETVATLGINVRHLRTFNFAVGCLLAGLSGVLAAGQIGLNPNMGDDLLMPSFIAIIVGGVGSLIGTLFGGLLIGMAAALTTVVYPSASEAVIYAILMAVLLLRPRGLDRRGRDDVMSIAIAAAAGRRRYGKPASSGAGRDLGGVDHRAALAAAAWRLHRACRTRAGVRAGGHGPQHAARASPAY